MCPGIRLVLGAAVASPANDGGHEKNPRLRALTTLRIDGLERASVTNVNSRPVGVVGLGYVGLGLAQVLSEAGIVVVGYDTNHERVDALVRGVSPISELHRDDLASMLTVGFAPSTSPSVLGDCGIVVFALPTPVGNGHLPDLGPLMSGLQAAARHRNSKQLWIIESTIAPGMVDSKVLPTLHSEGLIHGRDYLLALSPERIDPGGSGPSVGDIPKIVAGLTLEARTEAANFYAHAGFPIVLAGSIDEAAGAKLLENTYRAVNMALVNELAPLFSNEGIDPHEVIRLAATKPFGFQAFWPGSGVGGHCIPVDPWYLTSALGVKASDRTLITTALETNQRTPEKVAHRVRDVVQRLIPGKSQPSVLLCGMTYKANVGDFRESPGPEVAHSLHAQGISIGYHDPFLTEPLRELNGTPLEVDAETAANSYDIAVILQNHEQYRGLANLWGAGRVLSAAPSRHQFAPHIWSPEVGGLSPNEYEAIASDPALTQGES